jgi:sulfite exporter TauE/SafE
MSTELKILAITAASIGLFHTIFGPDHYLPFIMMSWARKWSVLKTAIITFLCGIGHIASSVVLGLIGVAFGLAVNNLVKIESVRGNIAAWLFIAFGLVYFVWGLRRAYLNKPHTHIHAHGEGEHTHEHTHKTEHVHIHDQDGKKNITPWVLFTIFVFGPCEPLIPLVMYPAAKHSLSGMIVVTAVFGTVTIVTMLTITLLALAGVHMTHLNRLERYTHAIAGATILVCGLAIQFLGL